MRKPLAIHHDPGSFSDGWVEYCERNNVPYVLVDCYANDVIDVVSECAGLMWHWSHVDASAAQFARQLTYSLEARGVPVFPNSRTSWHFDDKLGQKYLFEALDIPHVPSYAFYRKSDAIQFIRRSDYPLVFKLSRGAGSKNVALIHRRRQAERLIRRALGKGWKDRHRAYAVSESLRHLRRERSLDSARNVIKGVARMIYPHPAYRVRRIESGYVYFQKFIPHNDSDVRVVVIGNKAYGFRRMVRKGDFRASGSGALIYDRASVPIICVQIAFDSAEKIGMQTAAFDFVFNKETPLIVEVSYGFNSEVNKWLPGYWNRELQWQEGSVKSEEMIIEEFLSAILQTQN